MALPSIYREQTIQMQYSVIIEVSIECQRPINKTKKPIPHTEVCFCQHIVSDIVGIIPTLVINCLKYIHIYKQLKASTLLGMQSK